MSPRSLGMLSYGISFHSNAFQVKKVEISARIHFYGGLTQTPLVTFQTPFLDDGIGYYSNNRLRLSIRCYPLCSHFVKCILLIQNEVNTLRTLWLWQFSLNIYIQRKFHNKRSFLIAGEKLLLIRQQPPPHNGIYNLGNTKNHFQIFERFIPFRELCDYTIFYGYHFEFQNNRLTHGRKKWTPSFLKSAPPNWQSKPKKSILARKSYGIT